VSLFKKIPLRVLRILHWTLRIALFLLVIDLIYVATIWPDWKRIAGGPVPKSSFIELYEARQADRKFPQLSWQPVALNTIPRPMLRAVIVAEDSRFYDHSGFDLIAIKEAFTFNWNQGEFLLGASTISQQTTKNLFLSPSRDPIRKWHEVLLTWGLERNVRKSRILELYLNVAEFGRGVYGVQAAARTYYGIDAADLSLEQAAELAATLPSPVKHNPATRTERFQKRTQRILDWLNREQSAALTING
jgi:monofunctional biosynthetic peptidoglycan transglycosylase